MEMQKLLRPILFIIAGAVIGYFIANITILSINELKVSTTSGGGDVSSSNSLGLASFNGSWTLVSGTESFNDLNSVAVHCWKDKNVCNVAEANVKFNDMFSNNISYYEIKEWSDAGQITAVSNALCETQTLKADIKTKTVTLSETRNGGVDEAVCPYKDDLMVLNLGQKGFD